ncbi:hypothetical protein [Cellulophaga lytica]|uniref:hypothetical protein n=1 Tax=Cellulophaga lytica TaxID=979 RepID=UPI000B5C7F5A|nr:hypothetical protein [Cellulophaga lytica]SNQ44725.1 putative Haloalkane dehalogenase [Cellulophaga lytica]
MNKSNNIFQKFVLITGILNFPIGIGMMIQAISNKNPEILITNAVSGAFILFAGATLIWASKDLKSRIPIVVWNGLVRMAGVLLVLYASTIGNVPKEMLVISAMDFALAIIYVIGSKKITQIPFSKLILGKVKNQLKS